MFNDNDDNYTEDITKLMTDYKEQIRQGIVDSDKYLTEHKNSLSKQDIIKMKQVTSNMINNLISEFNDDTFGELDETEKEFINFLQISKYKIEDLFDKYL